MQSFLMLRKEAITIDFDPLRVLVVWDDEAFRQTLISQIFSLQFLERVLGLDEQLASQDKQSERI